MKIIIEMDATETRRSIESGDLLRLIDTCLEETKGSATDPVLTHTTVVNASIGGVPEPPHYVPVETPPPYQASQEPYAPPQYQDYTQQAPPQYQQISQNPQQVTPQQAQQIPQYQPPQQAQQIPQYQPPQQAQQYQPPVQMAPETAQQMPYPQNTQAPPSQMVPHQQVPPPQTAPAQPNGPGPEDIRAVLAPAMKAGGIDKIDALWAKFGVAKLSDLQPQQYAAAYTEAQALVQSMEIPF